MNGRISDLSQFTKEMRKLKTNNHSFRDNVFQGFAGQFALAVATFLVGLLSFLGGRLSVEAVRAYKPDGTALTQPDYDQLVNEKNTLENESRSLRLQLDEANEELAKQKKQNETLDNEISSLHSQLNEEAHDSNDKILKQATDYWNNEDYYQAVALLKTHRAESDVLGAQYHNYSKKYCGIVLEQIDSKISERSYEEAKTLLIDAKNVVEDSTELEEKLAYLNNRKTTKLSDVKINESRSFKYKGDERMEDSIGNIYSSDNLFRISASYKENYGFGRFHMDQDFSFLSGGRIAYSDESYQSNGVSYAGIVEIVAIDADKTEHPIYCTEMITRSSEPISVPDLNISDAKWLEFRFHNESDVYEGESPKIILADFMLMPD